MKHLGTQVLKIDGYILRPFQVGDASSMYNNYCKDPRVTKYLTWQPHRDVNETHLIIRHFMRITESLHIYNWAIVEESSGEVIGGIGSARHKETDDVLEVGYVLSYKFWNKGIMTKVLARVLAFYFEEVGLAGVFGTFDLENIGSRRILEKNGMVFAGEIIKRRFYDGDRRLGVCKITSAEYFAKQQK